MTPFTRPDLTPDESAKATAYAKIIVYAQADKHLKLRMVESIMIENMRLLKECNQHRAAAGLDQLPVKEPKL